MDKEIKPWFYGTLSFMLNTTARKNKTLHIELNIMISRKRIPGS